MRGPPAARPRFVAFLLAAVALAVTWLGTAPASAWTDATVRTANADVTLTPDGRAHVVMRARVRVDGGWLEGLDVDGLDPDAQLDLERPAVFRDAAGVAVPAEISVRSGGRVSLRFRRRTAPRRGEYDLELAWTTGLEGAVERRDGDRLRVRWVFPAWRFGLDAVEVRWHVPEGTHAPEAADPLSPVEVDLVDPHTWVFRRAHLPRTSDWATEVEVPAAAWPHATTREAATAQTPATPVAIASRESGELRAPSPAPRALLALLVAVAALVKHRDLERRSVRTSRKHEPLLPAPRALLWLASASLAAAAAATRWLDVPPPLLLGLAGVVVALGWQRGRLREARPSMHALSPVPSLHIRAARRDAWLGWLGPAAWLEPSRLGLLACGAALAVSAPLDGPSRALAALFAAVVASGTRTRLGTDPAVALRSLARTLEGLRVPLGSPVLSFALLARGANLVDPRVRIHASFEDARLARCFEHLQLDLVAGPLDGRLRLRMSARVDTPADVALRAWADQAHLVPDMDARRTTVELPVERRSASRTLAQTLSSITRLAPHERDATLEELLAAE